MEDFRLVLILAGALGIGGLLWHGLWSLKRQQRSDLSKEKPLADLYKEQQQRDEQGFDAHGVSAVRKLSTLQDERKEPSFGEAEQPPATTKVKMAEPEQAEFELEQPEMPVQVAPVAEPCKEKW